MIKIETPAINQIAIKYFNNIKPKIKKRVSFFYALLDVLYHGGPIASVRNHDLHPKSRLPIINLLLRTDHKVAKVQQYGKIAVGHLNPWVGQSYQIIRDILDFLNDDNYLKDIILATPENTEGVDLGLQAFFGINQQNHSETIFPLVKLILNYSLHSEYSYDIAAEIGINTCPYCNRIHINTVFDEKKNKIIRATFDHFLPQSKHPFLALTFFNLIPSCHWCNENLKHATNIGLDTQIHPFIEGYGNDCKFGIMIAGFYPKKSDRRNYKVILKENIDPIFAKHRRIFGAVPGEGSNNLFKIREIYNSHTDIVGELVVKADRYSDGHADSLYKIFGLLKTNKAEFYKFYFGNYFNDHDYHLRPMAKFTKDIVEHELPDFFK